MLLLPMLLALTVTQSVWTAAIAIFLFGGFIGAMDVAMNANAVLRSSSPCIARSCRRAMRSGALGGLIGSAIGGFLISHLGVLGHAEAATALSVLFLAVAWPMILSDQPASGRGKAEGAPALDPAALAARHDGVVLHDPGRCGARFGERSLSSPGSCQHR